jgi:hypothetical protein
LLMAEPELQPKTLFEHLQRKYPGRFGMDRCGLCGAGSSTGGQREGHLARCSSHKNTGLVSCVNQTSHIAGSWASLSMGRHFHI